MGAELKSVDPFVYDPDKAPVIAGKPVRMIDAIWWMGWAHGRNGMEELVDDPTGSYRSWSLLRE